MANPKVSVIVPNYNYARFLQQRLDSILAQTYRDFELILLDDGSTDGSLEILDEYHHHPQVSHFIVNKENSGNPFVQWRRGCELAVGEYIWIAESDDLAAPQFLESMVVKLDSNPNIGIAYCQSWRIDSAGTVNGSWITHTQDLDPHRWNADFMADGGEEIRRYLIYLNTIPNASGVLFRKSIYDGVGGVDPAVEKCGDWFLWLKMLVHSDLAFVAKAYNYFRVHEKSVIATTASLPGSYYDSVLREKLNAFLREQEDCKEIARILELNRQMWVENQRGIAYWHGRRRMIHGYLYHMARWFLARIRWIGLTQ